MTDLQLAQHLDTQHPNRWTQGHWYEATGPNGKRVEIRRSSGVGRNKGMRFLHMRFPSWLVIAHPDGTKERTNERIYIHTRINLKTGEWKDLT